MEWLDKFLHLFGRHVGHVEKCYKVVRYLHYVRCNYCDETEFEFGICKQCKEKNATNR